MKKTILAAAMTTLTLIATAATSAISAQASGEPVIYADACPAYVQQQIAQAKASGGSVLHIAASLKELSDTVKIKDPDQPRLILVRVFERENRLMAFCSETATFPLIVSGKQ